uniref:LysM domain-containing protein n=1 Tax=Candidatus Kentrum sp. MB TaxID=2138164 RepID=A0A451BEU4_9GAMM|nr:MAG: LysM domain-containing protein [Candidatus Kentron sp. MB]VFK34503.1 MAG: LysM domain-containing protein [Candidatus Kentron sp. MB]VFK76789.1 MAG: LysM domain-containing protein [Candidatus Kentron sp. MB]
MLVSKILEAKLADYQKDNRSQPEGSNGTQGLSGEDAVSTSDRWATGQPAPRRDSRKHETTYIVRKGDTLGSIAKDHGIGWKKLWEANRAIVPDPNVLKKRQTLIIPTL